MTVRTNSWLAILAGLLGGLGVGLSFGSAVRSLGINAVLTVGPGWLGATHLSALVIIGAATATAVLAGRWGWVVATVGLVGLVVASRHPGLTGISVDSGGSIFRWLIILALLNAAIVGGALAVLGGVDRTVRTVVGAGLAFGAIGGAFAWDYLVHLADILLYLPPALTAVAAGLGLAVALGRAPAGPAAPRGLTWRDWVLGATLLAVTEGAFWAYATQFPTGHSTGAVTIGPWYDFLHGSTIATVAAALFVIVGYICGGPTLAQWALVGFAAGLGSNAALLRQFLVGRLWDDPWALTVELVLTAAVGVVVGVVLIRLLPVVPWEAVALGVVAVTVWATKVDNLIDLVDSRRPMTSVRLVVEVAVAVALAAGLTRLIDRLPPPGSPRRVLPALAVLLGLAAFAVAFGLTHEGMSHTVAPVRRTAVAVGVAAVLALVLSLVGFGRRAAASAPPPEMSPSDVPPPPVASAPSAGPPPPGAV